MTKYNVCYIHRNKAAGFSIDKVTQTIIRGIPEKEEHYVPCATAGIKDVIKNILYCWRLRNKEQIFHITGDIHYCVLSLIGCKTVLTIHDTVLLDYHQYGILKRMIIKWFWYKVPVNLANKVVCISNSTKERISAMTGRDDISVIYDAIDSSFVEKVRTLNLNHPTILLIGTNPNKNLLRTFEAVKDIDCNLMIVGDLSKEQHEYLIRNKLSYSLKSKLSDEEIIKEYENADIVSFISLFEGFGMIVIEANKIGRPVICSDIPVLREVAGEAALFVNPYDVEDMREGFCKLIDNPDLCKRLICKGFDNVNRFEDSLIREQWINLYR